jgi:flagellar hook-associated protein 3 FlgL
MTDTPLNYASNEAAADEDYIITQNFTRDDLDTKKAYEGYYQTDDILNVDDQGAVTSNDVYRLRLAYNEIDDEIKKEYTKDDATGAITTTQKQDFAITTTNSDGTTSTIPVTVLTGTAAEQANYIPKDDEACLNTSTGEIIMGKDIYNQLYSSSTESFSFTYEKSNFVKDDQNPVMYFDCVNNDKDSYYYGVEYKKENEDIEYNVNFSQKLKINTEANDAFNINLGRDIDDLVTAVNTVVDIENQISKVETMIGQTTDEDELEKLNKIKERLSKQKDYAEDNMTAAFEKGVGVFQQYQQQISLAKADVGNRMTRLSLTKSRLTEQKTNFTNLKSQNEDIDLEEVVVGYSSAQLVYNASLTAASKVVQQTLLDFL